MKRRTVALIAGAAAVVLVAAGVTTWSLTRPTEAQAVGSIPVAISAPVPDDLTIGVIVSLSSAPGEGAEWKDAANGAVVAARRLALGGHDITVRAVDDKGTADGARAAAQELVDDGAAGIVVATSGSHVTGAVEVARSAGVPAVLPYVSDGSLAGDGVWLTGPTSDAISAALPAALKSASSVLLVDAGYGTPAGLSPAAIVPFAAGGDAAAFRAAVAAARGSRPLDAVLINGPASTQASVVQLLQSDDADLPIVVTPEATSPAFSEALVSAGGTLSTDLTTVGAGWSDTVALSSDADGRAMSAFLAGVRVLADDSSATTLFEDRSFASVAGLADSRSHDATVLLALAAASAGSTEPSAVASALGTSSAGAADGIAGPQLDGTKPTALVPGIVPLYSADQNLGLRPLSTDTTAPLVWFAGQPD
ncbi:ABC transporter substrate-binding protein [Microbacterium sp. Kw_RZR3]|uniref:ABC transporter substrate-binding protein n=1 Tax=Microbacterium sp. Kw_RZR3 TaxID=3032903 RepID=UPI0023DC35ED|nr:ABC transporter substrate-binding protein [Microbacterium sp. Kw_RZR3]MDF2047240.1 ABC transporter substrate-binding protein [Microbacterium sp. Kw_RZR3]